ncbi:hypothetical protein OXPF_14680 [Oxobacter pfennigii]|uniref:Radical SAM core domain-containing protein n=1 Tax=Oxobacter pfennigii TaxID=36849 RepID=A0A0P8WR10_9CLOT|nr:thioether cross-link-forming SCIFF peptide maturase [Oxobacter pfennigii]KPU44990.1 hypothetical protein OXPF_14680 [Oxobacter pfennigii]
MAIIHKFDQHGIKMLLDVNSGSFHIIDDIIYDIIDDYKKVDEESIIDKFISKYERDKIKEAIDEIKNLEDSGLLYCEDLYENVAKNDNEQFFIKAMCLNIAHDCNLRCKYCFAHEGGYKGNKSLMSQEVGKKAIDFVIKNSGPRKHIEVDLFGGEPLMNFNTIKAIVEYARQQEKEFNKEMRFTMTTNATLLNDEIIEYIDTHMTNVVLSIDGRKEVNDGIRINANGKGTYDDILPKIKRMVNRRGNKKQYYVRGTFTSKNLDFYNDVMELANNGFDEISIEPVVLPEGDELSLKPENLDTIFEQYEMLTDEIIKREEKGSAFKFYHFAIDINGGPCIYKRISGCGAGFEYIAVTPEGDIYPCHQFVGNDKYKMGTLNEGIINNEIINEFKNGHVYNKKSCSDCWAKFYCSGGCQANNYNFNGNILMPYKLGCEMQKKRVECALTIKAAQFLRNNRE